MKLKVKEKIRIRRKMITFLNVAFLMCIFLFSGCGKVETGKKEVVQVPERSEETEDVYVPEFMELEFNKEAEGDRLWVNNVNLANDRIFYGIKAYKTEEEKVNMYIHYRNYQNPIQLQSVPQEVFSVGESVFLEHCTYDEQNQFYLLWTKPEEKGYFLSKFDSEYKLLYTRDLSDIWVNDMNSSLRKIIVDKEGYLYGTSQNILYILNEVGELEKTVKLGTSNMSNFFIQEDGSLFISYYDRNGFALAEVNVSEGKKEDPISTLPVGCKEVWAGQNGKVLLNRIGKLWEFDMETDEVKELVTWTDVSISEEYIKEIRMMEEGDIIVLCTKNSADSMVPECEVVSLRKVDKGKLPVKETITVASLYQSDAFLTEAVAKFNKKNNRYRVEIKSYMDEGIKYTQEAYNDALNRFHAELVNGKAGDIINLKSMDWRNLARKGALEELSPYMSQGEGLCKEDLVENVVKAYEVDEGCYTIPRGFGIETLMGKASIVGGREDWDLNQVKKLADKYPDAMLIHRGNPYMLLQCCMQYGGKAFIDYEKAECDFNNQEFVDILEFSKQGGTGQIPNADLYSNVKMDRVLLAQVSIRSVEEIQMYRQLLGGEGVCVGYPTVKDGGQAIFSGEEMLAIASGSKNKDAAWAFLESFLRQESRSPFAFPILKKEFERKIEDACKVKYCYDEEGNLQYDENGQPLQERKTTWEYGSFNAEIYAATEEEIAELRKLLKYTNCNQTEEKIREIINEEVRPYFEGQKTASEVAEIIQNRIQLYLFENME